MRYSAIEQKGSPTMKILHIKGTQCSGKTYAIQPFLKRPDVAYWDVLDFYHATGCIVDDKMDWDRWEEIKDKVPKALAKFLKECKEKNLTAIVESGTNKAISHLLLDYENVTTIELRVPDDKTLIERAKLRNTDVKRVLEFKEMYLRKHACQIQDALTCEEAQATIKAKLDGINIGIIGTAGRKEDKDKMSKQLYTKMYNYAIWYLNRLHLKPEDIRLVSGGAAASDHIAVSLYLGNKSNSLKLHMPAQFRLDPPGFYGNNIADAANYYHKLFSQKMGRNTLESIARAITKGAQAIYTQGFKPRDRRIAKDSEVLLAFTWGEGEEPKQGSGTAYTWSNSEAKVKHHVPLKEL